MAGKTLAGALPKLQSDLLKCLEEAMYKAFMTTSQSGKKVNPAIAKRIRQDLEKAAKEYSMTFAKELSEPLSQAIYSYVSEIGIVLTPKGTLMAPQASTGILPVTGTASTTTKDITVI